MSTELHEPPEPGIASLVGGIVDDARHLFMQQIDLLKKEVRHECKQATKAAMSAALGIWIVNMGAVVLLFAAAHGISAAANIPLWVGYVAVGGSTAAIGGAVLVFAKKKAAAVELLPPPETAGALKENYQWITGQRRQ